MRAKIPELGVLALDAKDSTRRACLLEAQRRMSAHLRFVCVGQAELARDIERAIERGVAQ